MKIHFTKYVIIFFSFLYQVEPGYQESQLLKQLTTKEDLEVKADNCTKVK